MKQFAVLSVLLAFSVRAVVAQPLQVYAGADTVWCTFSNQTGPRLGAQSSATGGIPPHTFLWRYAAGGLAFVLDSVFVERPKLMFVTGADSTDFVVEVSDAANAVAYDTVRVYFSRHIEVTMDCRFEKAAGDTIRLWPNGTSQFLPILYQWTPSFSLSSDTSAMPKSWTPVNTGYIHTATDRFGCQSQSSCSVSVWPASIAGTASSGSSARITPSPATPDTRIEISADLLGSELRISSVDGRVIHSEILQATVTPMAGRLPSAPGLYFYRLRKTGGPVQSGRLVVQE